MSKRFAWLLGLTMLVAIGVLLACGTGYNASNDGLVLVTSQGSGLVETYSFDLGNGQIHSVINSPIDTSNETCVLKGIPSSIVLNPAGTYAFSIINQNSLCPGSATGIAAFRINSDGTMTQVGSFMPDPNPVSLAMDSAGKFLFVAEGLSTTSIKNAGKLKTPCAQTMPSPADPQAPLRYGICAYTVGSGGILTVVPGTFNMPMTPQAANFAALAVTPTILPALVNGVQVAPCSSPGNNPPTKEFLYAVDSVNYEVWEFTVDMSTGALGGPGKGDSAISYPTGPVPSGVTVDSCDRFVYVSNAQTNTISAFTLCSVIVTGTCPYADGTLLNVSGSPFALSGGANSPGQLLVDPFGKFLYVLDTLSNQVSTFQLSPLSGGLTAGNPAVVSTGSEPTSMTIRADDNWLFVANFNSATISQFVVTPATGGLSALPTVLTDNLPWGVAVK